MTSSPFLIGILGAGLGSRLQNVAKAKPLAPVGGKPLLAHLLDKFLAIPGARCFCALRDELLSREDKASVPAQDQVRYLFVNTDSSLHTLGALVHEIKAKTKPTSGALFSMADTVLLEKDFQDFVRFCRDLRPNDNALLVTRYVDDEKPLWVEARADGTVKSFSQENAAFVTSGMYYLSPEAMDLALQSISAGVHKMRNFLQKLLESGAPIKVFVVEKTIDVDHPSDLVQAESFLRGPQEE